MPFLKNKMTHLTGGIFAAALMSAPAFAGENPPAEAEDTQANWSSTSGPFGGADSNADGVLDLSEFTLYAGDQAVQGDADFIAIVSTGDYETAFKLMDANADGVLDADEVSGQSDGLEDKGDMMPETEEADEAEPEG